MSSAENTLVNGTALKPLCSNQVTSSSSHWLLEGWMTFPKVIKSVKWWDAFSSPTSTSSSSLLHMCVVAVPSVQANDCQP